MNKKFSLATRIAAFFLKAYLWLVAKTSRIIIEGQEQFRQELDAPVILAIWHNKLFLLPLIACKLAPTTKTVAVISKSRDGDIPSALATSFPQGEVIRIGHKTRHLALQEIIRALHEKKIILITPDGPRGPVGQVKPGVIFASQQTNALVFPCTWQCSSTVCLKSWDRFQIPLPFSRLQIQIKSPKQFVHGESLQDGCLILKHALDH